MTRPKENEMLFTYDELGRRTPAVRRTLLTDLAVLTGVAVVTTLVVGFVYAQIFDTEFLYTVGQILAIVAFGVLNGVWWWIRGKDLDVLVEDQRRQIKQAKRVDYNATGEE